MEIRRGDIYYADLTPVVGCEQGGRRPVLVIQNDVGNHHGSTVIVAAITSGRRKRRLPTHIGLPRLPTGLRTASFAMLEQVRTIDRMRLGASDWTGLLVMMGKTLKNRAFLSVVFLDMFEKIVYTVYAVEGKE